MANRLREQLHRCYPQCLWLAPSANEPWLRDLLELAPTPQRAHRVTVKRIAQLLRKHRIRRHSAEEVVAELRAPPLHVAEGTTEAATAHIELLLPRLRLT